MAKTIKLYTVTCGLMVNEEIFSPYPDIDMNYYADLEKVKAIYESITAQSFDRKEVMLAKLKGLNTYTKYITQVEMPMDMYEQCFEDEPSFPHTPDERQGFVNSMVFSDEVNHQFDNIKDEVFEIEGGLSHLYIANLRQYASEGMTVAEMN
jgi:hypothetical protein